MDLLQPIDMREGLGSKEVYDDRKKSSDQEEPEQGPVKSAWLEEATGTEGAPDHACVEMSSREGTSETVRGKFGITNVGDVSKCPIEDGYLTKSSDNKADYLDQEETSRRDLKCVSVRVGHLETRTTYTTVDTKLQILRKGKAFDTRNVSNVEEPDVGQDLAFPDVTSDDATEDIDLDLDVASSIHPSELQKSGEYL